MLDAKQILERVLENLAPCLIEKECAGKLAEILDWIYVDILAEVESMIEFRLGSLPESLVEEKIIVPQSQQLIGKMPWSIRKARLEAKFRKLESSSTASVND